MPLLKGRFDPKQLNSTRLAIAFHEAYYGTSGLSHLAWERLDQTGRRFWVNVAQAVMDELAEERIIQ